MTGTASQNEVRRPGMGFLGTVACLVIVIAGIKAAGVILVKILLALLIAIVCIPPMRALRRVGLAGPLAVGGVVALVLVVLLALSWIVAGAVSDFTTSIDFYQERLETLVADAIGTVESIGIEVGDRPVSEIVDSKAVFAFAGSVAGSITSTLSDVLVVVFIVVFMLLEAGDLPAKLRRALGDPDADLAGFQTALDQVYGYLSVKSLVSFITGVLVWGLCSLMGVDFAVLWGLTAFLLNYIPTVGSILAAIPAVILAILQLGAGSGGALLAGYLAINVFLGNVIEPRLMGRKLGLSPLVVILSLLFWSWVWGPVGMLLSVPLTTVLKIAMEGRDDLRPVAVLLGPAGDDADVSS